MPKKSKRVDFNVKIFYNGEQIQSEDLHKITIKSPVIDRIVNDVVERNSPKNVEKTDCED